MLKLSEFSKTVRILAAVTIVLLLIFLIAVVFNKISDSILSALVLIFTGILSIGGLGLMSVLKVHHCELESKDTVDKTNAEREDMENNRKEVDAIKQESIRRTIADEERISGYQRQLNELKDAKKALEEKLALEIEKNITLSAKSQVSNIATPQ